MLQFSPYGSWRTRSGSELRFLMKPGLTPSDTSLKLGNAHTDVV